MGSLEERELIEHLAAEIADGQLRCELGGKIADIGDVVGIGIDARSLGAKGS